MTNQTFWINYIVTSVAISLSRHRKSLQKKKKPKHDKDLSCLLKEFVMLAITMICYTGPQICHA